MINLHIMTNSLIVICNDTHVISAQDLRYKEILKLLGNGTMDEDKIKNILFYKEEKEDNRVEVDIKNDKLLIDNIEMPEGIKKQFLELRRRKKSKAYLANFWDKLQKNPNKNSIQMLYTFLEHNGHFIMADGDFIAYKAVTSDLLDYFTKTNKHKIGCVIKMDREQVDDNPNNMCSYGLHVCSPEYLRFFNNKDNPRYLEVLINPKDVVAVPDDYNGTKMRVARYKVYREVSLKKIESRIGKGARLKGD